MSTSITSALLKRINDVTSTHPYGDGWLVDTPLTYSDGDTITLFNPHGALGDAQDRFADVRLGADCRELMV